MSALCVPLVFKPVYKDYIWGGERLAAVYGRTDTPEVCAESWEIAARPDGESIVASGPFAGRGLTELSNEYGTALIGTRAPAPHHFPLLFKVIDARDRLSVQVHPNAENAESTGGEPKTEMWVVLDCLPGALLYAGLAEGATPESLRRSLADGTAATQLVAHPVEPGQALFIPGGLAHAIGAGCLIYEVQQNSNSTYRLFDWNRVGAGDQSRPLHVEKGLVALDWSLPVPQMIDPVEGGRAGAGWSDVVACDYFNVRRLNLTEPLDVALDGLSFHALFVTAGAVAVSAGGERVLLRAGQSALVPADASVYHLEPDATACLLVTTL